MGMTFGRDRVFDKTVAWLQQKARISWIPADKLRRAVAANQINGFADDTTGGGRVVGGLAVSTLATGSVSLSCQSSCLAPARTVGPRSEYTDSLSTNE